MDLEHKAIERIKMASEMSLHHYGKPLVCTYSGGKDSDVLLELFRRSGARFEVHNSHTTADAPQTVRYIKEKFYELENQGVTCNIQKPKYNGSPTSMWSLIPLKRFPPWRRVRYCCSVLKETGCSNRFIATGVRWSESNARKERSPYESIANKKADSIKISDEIMLLNDNDEKRKLIEHCELKAKSAVNPIIDWNDKDIWEYIRSEGMTYNPLYDMGYNRVGCIGCPMAGKGRWKEFADFPKYQELYIHAFDRMLDSMRNDGSGRIPKWKSGYEVFLWWMEDQNIEGQMDLFKDGFIA